jgi:hypothetical protein
MILQISLLLVLLQILLLVKAIKEKQFLQVLPSTVWASIMLTPFSVLLKYFPINTSMKHGVAICLVAVVLQFSDYIALRSNRRARVLFFKPTNLKFDAFFTISITSSILVPILHFTIAKQIPFLEQISGYYSPEEIADFRENFIKLLDVPYYLKVLPNYIVTIFGPYSLIVLIAKKKYYLTFFLFLWCAFYSLSSTADLPILIFVSMILLGSIPLLPLKKIKIVSIMVTSGLLLTIFSGITLTKTIESSSRPCATQNPSLSTPGDKWRSCAGRSIVWFNVVTDRIGYRVFLTPIEVSNLWYQYYKEQDITMRSVLSILNRDLTKMPANVIGNWSFVDKFPGKYKKTNASYSSVDADAFSFGSLFFIFMLLGLFLMRLGATSHFVIPSDKAEVLSVFMVAQLSIFPFQSSIQAILLSQGFLIILAVYFYEVYKLKNPKNLNAS